MSLNRSITKIARDVKIDGRFSFKGLVIIEGSITGKVNSEDLLTITESGNVESSIKTKDAVVAGNFRGDMIVTGLVRIKPTGKFIGNLTQKNGASLIIEKGGLLEGESFVPDN